MINAEDLQGLLRDGVVVDESGDESGMIGQEPIAQCHVK